MNIYIYIYVVYVYTCMYLCIVPTVLVMGMGLINQQQAPRFGAHIVFQRTACLMSNLGMSQHLEYSMWQEPWNQWNRWIAYKKLVDHIISLILHTNSNLQTDRNMFFFLSWQGLLRKYISFAIAHVITCISELNWVQTSRCIKQMITSFRIWEDKHYCTFFSSPCSVKNRTSLHGHFMITASREAEIMAHQISRNGGRFCSAAGWNVTLHAPWIWLVNPGQSWIKLPLWLGR